MAVIALDLDGTVGNYSKLLHSDSFKNGIIQDGNYVEPKTYGMIEKGYFDSKEQFLKAHKILCSNIYGGIGRMDLLEDGVDQAIQEWQKQGHEVIVTTARLMPDHDDNLHKKVIKDTKQWVMENIPTVDDIAIVRGGEKQSVNADIYIDDSPHEIANLRKDGYKVLIRHQLYNKDIDGNRVCSLHDVLPNINVML